MVRGNDEIIQYPKPVPGLLVTFCDVLNLSCVLIPNDIVTLIVSGFRDDIN